MKKFLYVLLSVSVISHLNAEKVTGIYLPNGQFNSQNNDINMNLNPQELCYQTCKRELKALTGVSGIPFTAYYCQAKNSLLCKCKNKYDLAYFLSYTSNLFTVPLSSSYQNCTALCQALTNNIPSATQPTITGLCNCFGTSAGMGTKVDLNIQDYLNLNCNDWTLVKQSIK